MPYIELFLWIVWLCNNSPVPACMTSDLCFMNLNIASTFCFEPRLVAASCTTFLIDIHVASQLKRVMKPSQYSITDCVDRLHTNE